MNEGGARHYVYAHHRASDGRIFYVGKGSGRRAWSRSGRNKRWHYTERKHGLLVKIVRFGLSEACAFTLEKILISANRQHGLSNYVDGGGGTSGWRHSEETKERLREKFKGRVMTQKMRDALALANRMKTITPEIRARMSAAASVRKRAPHSLTTRALIARAHLGLRPTPETLLKMSLSKKGKSVGRNSPCYDHEIRSWENSDGRQFVGTRGDLINEFGLRDSCVSSVISGRQKSVKGWKIK